MNFKLNGYTFNAEKCINGIWDRSTNYGFYSDIDSAMDQANYINSKYNEM